MKAMSETDRMRLAGIAGLLSSESDGEALNAARALVRSLAKFGVRPEDLLAPPPAAALEEWIAEALRPEMRADRAPSGPHVAMIDELLEIRWRITLSKRSEGLLTKLRRQETLLPTEAEWISDLHQKMLALRHASVEAARENMAEDLA